MPSLLLRSPAAAKVQPLLACGALRHSSSAWVPSRGPQQLPRRCSGSGARRRQLRRQAAGGPGSGPSSGDGEERGIDIDALAARLSQEAERLRQSGASLGSEDASSDDDVAAYEAQPDAGREEASRRQSGGGQPDLLRPFGYAVRSSEGDVLAAVGEGGFSPEEFTLMQELGTVSIQQSVSSVDLEDSPLPVQERSARTAVIAYTASFFSGMPFQDPVVVLAKEYLPGAKAVACNELQVLKHLTGMPEQGMKWATAAAPLSANPPIVRLLGYFTAGQTEKAQSLLQGEDAQDALWVVLKWDGLAPLALYPSAQQTSGIGLGRLFGAVDSSMLDRARMLRSITRGCLGALAYCHAAGVVHGALGSGSVMLSTFDDRAAARLVVKLDNFGFARRISGITQVPGGRGSSSGSGSGSGSGGGGQPPAAPSAQPSPALADDTPLVLGQREDLRALAVVLLECMLSALARSGPSPLTAADSIQRLLGEVFAWDLAEFRQYCQDEPDWQAAVELLSQDDDAGWRLLADLAGGTSTAAELAASRFCEL